GAHRAETARTDDEHFGLLGQVHHRLRGRLEPDLGLHRQLRGDLAGHRHALVQDHVGVLGQIVDDLLAVLLVHAGHDQRGAHRDRDQQGALVPGRVARGPTDRTLGMIGTVRSHDHRLVFGHGRSSHRSGRSAAWTTGILICRLYASGQTPTAVIDRPTPDTPRGRIRLGSAPAALTRSPAPAWPAGPRRAYAASPSPD